MLEGRKFHVLTDHKPLIHALRHVSRPWSARQTGRLAYIAEYTLDIWHTPGAENVVADNLSRPGSPNIRMQTSHSDNPRVSASVTTTYLLSYYSSSSTWSWLPTFGSSANHLPFSTMPLRLDSSENSSLKVTECGVVVWCINRYTLPFGTRHSKNKNVLCLTWDISSWSQGY